MRKQRYSIDDLYTQIRQLGIESVTLIRWAILENNGKLLIARSYMDIPNEDGVIYIPNKGNINIGDFIKVRIIDTQGYDLIGEIV